MTYTKHTTILVDTLGETDIHNITPQLKEFVESSKINQGILNATIPGSTASLITLEHEPGLIQDIINIVEKLIPRSIYDHNKLNGDDNGHSHLRSTLFGTSVTIPIVAGKLCLGVWQQVALVDFDTSPRSRQIEVILVGDFQ